jgi:hypothetical protein
MADDGLGLCRKPSRCPSSWTEVRNRSFDDKDTFIRCRLLGRQGMRQPLCVILERQLRSYAEPGGSPLVAIEEQAKKARPANPF